MSDPLTRGKKALAALATLDEKHQAHMAKHKTASAKLRDELAECRAEYEAVRKADPEAMPDFGVAIYQKD